MLSRPLAASLLAAALVACSSDDDGDDGADPPAGGDGEARRIAFDFDDGAAGWESGFADYPAGREDFFELDAGVEPLPAPLETRSGFKLSGSNRSDDLFMFIARRVDGFEPDTRHELDFEVTFATNAPSGCVGIGGPPGEAVTIKAGAAAVRPEAVDDGGGFLLLNLDKGQQSAGGADAIALGDFANSTDCEAGGRDYELKTLDADGESFTARTDADGALWVLFGTDSGFEGATTIYFVSGEIVATPVP